MSYAQQWGLSAAVHEACYRGLQGLFGYRAYLGVVTPVNALRYTEKDSFRPGYNAVAINADQLSLHAATPGLDLSADFIEAFARRGDRCFGVVRDGRLISYSCYSRLPAPIGARWTVHFDPRFTYVYKSFTVPAERGKRLHGLAMSAALRRFAEEDGCVGLIAYVETNQHASRRSGKRMGHRSFGVVRAVDRWGVRRSWRSRGCDGYGFDVRVTTQKSTSDTVEMP